MGAAVRSVRAPRGRSVPLLALGFPVPTLIAHFAVRRFQGLFVPANLRIDLSGVRWVIATPQFHHWHHADDPAVHNRNFAGELPLVDWLFGTLHLPHGAWPERYGIGEDAPAGYLAQRAWPFRIALMSALGRNERGLSARRAKVSPCVSGW